MTIMAQRQTPDLPILGQSEEPAGASHDVMSNANNMHEYEVKESIGKGAFGNAFIALHKRTGQKYVMKKVRLARQTDRQRKASHQEMKIVSALRHPYIVGYKDSWIEKGHTVCIVCVFAEGGDLTNQLRRRCRDMKHFSEQHLKEWATQMLLALEYMHEQNVLHRDLKSGNVFLNSEGEVLIGDFGLAKVLQEDEVAQSVVGTPNYMCPEILSDQPYGFKSDVWSLGCILYELTALRPAFQAFNVQGLVAKIKKGSVTALPPLYTKEWRSFVVQCLTREPSKRPTVKALLASEFLRPYVDHYRAVCEDRAAQEFEAPPATDLPSAEECVSPPHSPRNAPLRAPVPGPARRARPATAPEKEGAPGQRLSDTAGGRTSLGGKGKAPLPGGRKSKEKSPFAVANAGLRIPPSPPGRKQHVPSPRVERSLSGSSNVSQGIAPRAPPSFTSSSGGGRSPVPGSSGERSPLEGDMTLDDVSHDPLTLPPHQAVGGEGGAGPARGGVPLTSVAAPGPGPRGAWGGSSAGSAEGMAAAGGGSGAPPPDPPLPPGPPPPVPAREGSGDRPHSRLGWTEDQGGVAGGSGRGERPETSGSTSTGSSPTRGLGGAAGGAVGGAVALEAVLELCGELFRTGRVGELGTVLANFNPRVVPPVVETPLADLAPQDAVFQLGDKVMVGKQRRLEGTIRYYGCTAFAEGEWVGIELEGPEGKNDGVVQGVRYFPCRPNCGLFVKASILRPDLSTALNSPGGQHLRS